jgi:hypothetical protein
MTTAAKPIPPRPPPPGEIKPVIGGRLWIAVALLGGLGLIANPVFNEKVIRNWAPAEDIRTDFSKWKAGSETDVRVTVVTADSTRLACGHAGLVDGAHCAYGGDRILWPHGPDEPADDNGPNLIQPYRTSPDNALVMLIGIWAQPDVAMRLHREPPNGVNAKRLNRFDVTCKVKFIEKWDKVDVRWDVSAPWQTEKNTWVARAESCSVIKS